MPTDITSRLNEAIDTFCNLFDQSLLRMGKQQIRARLKLALSDSFLSEDL